MPLHIHRAERADVLAATLAELLAAPLPDPFATEVVAVPAKGVERWLAQRLSSALGVTAAGSDDGVAANIAFPSPGALVAEVLAAAAGIAPDDDPWTPDRMVWTLLRVIDESAGEPWCAVPARHLGVARPDAGAEHRRSRRYATARRLAALFDGYASRRPSVLTEWATGSDTDGTGRQLPDDLRWQAALWRRLRATIDVPGPAERLTLACDRLRAEPDVVDLPTRLSLFGATRAAADQLAVVSALAAHRDVHLWLVHPSPVLWDRLARGASGNTSGNAEHRGRADGGEAAPAPGAAAGVVASVRHPLLSALGRDIRELQQRLPDIASDTRHGVVAKYVPAGPGNDPGCEPPTLLRTLQEHIRDDRWPPEVHDGDGTVAVHACHGPVRQVEVLRECLLGLFAADPALQPRDVLVICPDVEAYAPLVRAAFGPRSAEAGDVSEDSEHPAHRLRARLADRGRAAANPLLLVVEQLLDMADGRVTVTEVLDLAATETVRRRCEFDDDDIERLREWAVEAGARWGIGQRQRQAFGLAEFAQNTLNSAVDRILLGVTAGETASDWLDLALPLGDVDSNDVDLAGRFAEYVDRLAVVLRDLRGPRPAAQWSAILARALDLLTDVPEPQAWLRTEAHRELAAATAHAGDIELRLDDIAALLRNRFADRPTRTNFRTGELTVCGMAPLRSVPHRVVVLLGVDDEVFPRATTVDGDDVLARNPQPGERDARVEDRQLLLDAILAAREKLLLLYTGADPVTGAHRPPAVPVAELLDVLHAHIGPDGMARVVTRHPLQAHDPRNFRPERPFSFDGVALAGAVAYGRPPARRPRLPETPLPAVEPADIGLAELISFVEHPIRGFLWQRLGLRIPDRDDEVDDRLPIELDGLAGWHLGERMLSARLTGADPADLRAAEWRRGTLPPAGLGAAVLDEVERTVETLVRAVRNDYRPPPRAVDIAVDLGAGRRLTGTVPEVHGDLLVRTTYSRVSAKHRIGAWVALLALAVGDDSRDRPWRAVITGRGRFGRPAWRCELTAPPASEAREILRDLAALRDTGLTEPLPIVTAATATYAERRFRGAEAAAALEAAEHEFLGSPDGPTRYGEHTDRHLRYLWGPSPRLGDLAAAPAPPGEPAEPTRFGSLARRLWAPVLRAEQQGAP